MPSAAGRSYYGALVEADPFLGVEHQAFDPLTIDMTPALLERQRSEQYLTSSQTRAHFLRQENGRPHLTHSLLGRVAFVKRWLFEFTSISRHLDGPAWKALIEEEFGDAIMSAIDFNFDFEREANPKGDRLKITMSGKFLPYKYYGNEQGIPDYGFNETS